MGKRSVASLAGDGLGRGSEAAVASHSGVLEALPYLALRRSRLREEASRGHGGGGFVRLQSCG